MTCSVCTHQWCWLCRGTYSRNHYSPLNPLGCPNLQGGSVSRQHWPLWRIYLLRLRTVFFIILLILLSPLYLVLGPSIALSVVAYQGLRRRNSESTSILLTILVWVIGLLATPLIIVIGLPVMLSYWCLRFCGLC
jgi:hypothetical protein